MKTLVSQELRPLSWGKFKSLLNKYDKNKSAGRWLSVYVDMDYLTDLEGEDRQFMVGFLEMWYRKYLDSHTKRRDVYHQYDKGSIGTNAADLTAEQCIEFIESSAEAKPIKMWDKKLINSYTLRDYMPSRSFSENEIIEYIDHTKRLTRRK